MFAVVSKRMTTPPPVPVERVRDGIEFIDAETWYEHPIATIAAYDDVLRGLPEGTPAFVIGEVQFGDSEAEWTAWTRYEAALNQTLHEHNARVVCPYDARTLPPTVVAEARRTHPYLVNADAAARNADYLEPGAVFRLLPPTAAIPATAPDLDMAVDGDLRSVRSAFKDLAAGCLDHGRVDDLTVAVNEVLTNALVHGGGSARVRLWCRESEGLTCVVDDDGAGIDDPLVGYARPSPGGYGAWLARRLFDRTEFISSPTGGLTVILVATPANGTEFLRHD